MHLSVRHHAQAEAKYYMRLKTNYQKEHGQSQAPAVHQRWQTNKQKTARLHNNMVYYI